MAEIEAFALAYNSTQRAFMRVGYGFSRARNGAAMLHAVTCLPTVTGKWQHRGGGAFWNNRGHLHLGQDADRGPGRAATLASGCWT